MTDIPEDVMELARDVAREFGKDFAMLGPAGVVLPVARAILADRAAQAERMARLEAALKQARWYVECYDTRSQNSDQDELLTRIDALLARALSQEGSDA